MIGIRLRRARLGAKFSLRELASLMGGAVSAQAIGRYENDLMMPSSNVLIQLAGALEVTAEYLLGNDQIVLQSVAYKRSDGHSEKLSHSIKAKILDHVQRTLDLEQLIEIDSIPWKSFSEKAFAIDSLADAEIAANTLRVKWRLGEGPIMSVATLLESYSIQLMSVNLPSDFSGSQAIVRADQGRCIPVIVINKNQNVERQRFTYLHELAHLVLKFSPNARTAFVEKASDRFAGALLVNRNHLAYRLGGTRTALSMGELLDLKRYFRVSLAALVGRCRQVELITQALYLRLWNQIKEGGFNSPETIEPFNAQSDLPSQLERMCMFAVSEQLISESKAAEILQISHRQLAEWLDLGLKEQTEISSSQSKITV